MATRTPKLSARDLFLGRCHLTASERHLLARLATRMAERITEDVCQAYGLSGLLRKMMRVQVGTMTANALVEVIVEVGRERAISKARRRKVRP